MGSEDVCGHCSGRDGKHYAYCSWNNLCQQRDAALAQAQALREELEQARQDAEDNYEQGIKKGADQNHWVARAEAAEADAQRERERAEGLERDRDNWKRISGEWHETAKAASRYFDEQWKLREKAETDRDAAEATIRQLNIEALEASKALDATRAERDEAIQGKKQNYAAYLDACKRYNDVCDERDTLKARVAELDRTEGEAEMLWAKVHALEAEAERLKQENYALNEGLMNSLMNHDKLSQEAGRLRAGLEKVHACDLFHLTVPQVVVIHNTILEALAPAAPAGEAVETGPTDDDIWRTMLRGVNRPEGSKWTRCPDIALAGCYVCQACLDKVCAKAMATPADAGEKGTG